MLDSGVEWIGRIPSHWRVLQTRRVCDLTTGWRDTQDAEPGGEYPFFVRSQTIERIGTYSFEGEAVLTSGDGAGVGKIFHHHVGKLEFHQRVYLYHAFRHVTGRFFFYYLREHLHRVVLAGNAKSTVDSLRRPMLQEFPVVVPSIPEQRAIVSFLDRKIAVLDSLLCKKARLAELLDEKRHALVTDAVTKGIDRNVPMKRSSIEWLDEIPEHWDVQRGRFLFRELALPPRPDDGVVTAFRDGQVTLRENRRTDGFMLAEKETGYQHVREGDLVMHSMDAFAGAIGVSESSGKCTPEYVVMEPSDERVSNPCYARLLRVMAKRNYIFVISPSVRERAPRFRFVAFKDVPLPLPSLKEQREILHYVERESPPLVKAASKLQEQVASIEEYREALISAAVTGKLDVSKEEA